MADPASSLVSGSLRGSPRGSLLSLPGSGMRRVAAEAQLRLLGTTCRVARSERVDGR